MSEEVNIPVTIKETNGIERVREPVSIGIPFPKGEVTDPSLLCVLDKDGGVIPFATKILNTWFDGSSRWVLFDLQISLQPYEETACFITTESKRKSEGVFPYRIRIEENAEEFIVRTGEAEFYVNRAAFQPFKQVKLNDSETLDRSRLLLVDDNGSEWEARAGRSFVESYNNLKAILNLEGCFGSVNGKRDHDLRFKSRLFFWAGYSFASVEFTIWNPEAARHPGGLWDLGDEGSRFFKELSFELSTKPGDHYRSQYCAEPAGKVVNAGDVCIYQDSSGGENWKSRNHVNHLGRVPISFRGYRTYRSGDLIDEGLRATPIISITNGKVGIAGTLRHFWQNFPSSLEADGNCLRIGVFPKYFSDMFELQGGEQKTHRVWLHFNSGDVDPNPLAWVHYPLIPRASTEWCCQSGVFPYLIPEDKIPNQFPHKEAYEIIQNAIKGGSTFFNRREIIDEYGWRNFGDLYADHENQLYEGKKPIISHYNNQYDLINSFIKEYVRSGDNNWSSLAEELAGHVIDFDIYHTEKDRYYNKGLFWHTDHYTDAATSTHRSYSRQTQIAKKIKNYGGGPSHAHVYSQGLLNYYFLTGDQRAKEAVMDLACFVVKGIEGPDQPLSLFKAVARNSVTWVKQHLSNDSITPYGLLDGPGRASGNGLSVLIDAYQLTKERDYLSKAEYLIRQCIHPKDDLSKRRLSDVNMRLMYTVFLQSLGKYMDVKAEMSEFDKMYFYSRESLLHYAKWMLGNEVPFLSIREKLDFPNFATRAATDIRKAHVLMLAAFYSEEDLKEEFIKKAKFFFENSIRDLLSLETRTLTRPLAILMQNIDLPLYSAVYSGEKSHPVNTSYHDFGFPNDAESLRYFLKANVKLFGRLINCVTSRKGKFESA